MKTEGIHHVLIVVKDMDRTVEFLSRVFEMDFEEVPWTSDRFGMRVCFSLPDGQMELFSIVDPAKALETPYPLKAIAEYALGGGEGLYALCLRVKDAEEACADAKRKGVRVAGIVEQRKVGPYHNFKELFFSEEEMPIKRLYLIAFYPPEKIVHDHRIYQMDEPEESN